MSTKYTKIFVGLMAAVMMVSASSVSAAALTQAQVNAIVSLLQSFGADQTTINNVQASLTGGAVTPTTTTGIVLSKSLKMGDNNADVKNLQIILNKDAATQVASTGTGSAGNESTYFGSLTKAAVIKFQNKYASEVLTPVGLTAGTGYVGAMTIAKLNAVAGGVTTTTTTGGITVTVPTGTGLTLSSATQPAATLAPQSAAMVPFTKVTLTAGTDGDVVVNGINIERTGLANDAVFAGAVLLDETGAQLGIAKTFNSNHQATIGEAFTVKAGQSRTMTIAGNMAAALGSYAGQVAYLSVTGANTTATVSGLLPITGAGHNINASLILGTAVGSLSSYDPGTTATKPIGTTGYKFTGVRITAGSVENVRLKSIRFYQAGSAGSGDLSNVMVYVDGASYPTTVSTDGKYYAANLGSGIVIEKGLAKDAWITGDITGSGSSGRNIDFDIQKNTDVYVMGETYGYGIIAGGTVNGGTLMTATPSVNGYAVTISSGSFTSVTKATSVAAQNIAINLANQVLGGYVVDITGEAISVQSQIFHFTSSVAVGSNLLTSVSLYDQNGAVVAGPFDAAIEAGTNQKVTFATTVTYPIGKSTYTLKGRIPTGTANGTTITASTTPSTATDWTSITGQTTGNSIPLALTVATMNSMTVKSAALAVAQSTVPAAQTIVAGSNNVTFANYQLDASQSGEDVRLSSITLKDTIVTAVATNLTGCQLWDGATALNTGSNVVNPTAALVAATPFSFDQILVVAKGTVKTITLKCNVASGITGSFTWNITAEQIAALTVTGATSGSTVVATGAVTTGATQTIGSGTLVVALDASSPAYTIAVAGSTGVTLGAYRFTAANDSVNLNRVGLSLGSVTASSSASDFTQVTLWSGAVQVGTAEFVGTNRNATSTLSTPVLVPKDGSVVIVVKGDLAAQGASVASHPGALLTVDVDVNGATGSKNTSGTGVGSGAVVDPSGSTTVSGVRVFKTVPTIAKQTSGMSSTLIAQSGIDLYRFSISANAKNDLALKKLVVNIATSSVSTANGTTSVTNLKVYAYTDPAFSTTVGGSFTAGQVVATITGLVNNGDNAAVLSSILTIPAGQTYYFKVVGDVAQVAGTTGSAGTVSTKIIGDAAYDTAGTLAGLMAVYNTALGNFVWSPLSTSTTASLVNADWTDGYQVPGLPSGGTDSFTLTK